MKPTAGSSSADDGHPSGQEPQCDSARSDGAPGCEHYLRRCKLVAPCCNEVFWCRHCHNKIKNDDEKDAKKAHQLDRTKVQEVVCGCCNERQSVAASCTKCGVTFGEYFCEPCRFYDNDTSKGQFHCDGCGICRVGFRENFFHCDVCVACLPLSLRDNHKCIQESLRVNCPVCLEFLMDSLKTANIMKCGHAIHSACQSEFEEWKPTMPYLQCHIFGRGIDATT